MRTKTFTEQKTGIIWSLLAVGMTKMVLWLVPKTNVSYFRFQTKTRTISSTPSFFRKPKKKVAKQRRELWVWLSRAIHETKGTPLETRPWDVRWSTESFQASSPRNVPRFCPTAGGPRSIGDPPGLETGGKTPKTIWMRIENIERYLGKHIPPKKN